MSAWNVYILAALLLLASLFYLTRRWGALSWRLAALLAIAFTLLTPAAVPGADALAPAWQVAAFEYLFGSKDLAVRALWPLAMLLLVFAGVLAVLVYVRRRPPAST